MSSKDGLKLDIFLRENPNSQIGYMGIRIVGSEQDTCPFRAPYYQNLFSTMEVMKSNVIDRDVLAQSRVWKNTEYRQENKSFVVVNYSDYDGAPQTRKTYMEETAAGANTNCVYFRSEWGTFTVSDKEDKEKRSKWDSKSNTT